MNRPLTVAAILLTMFLSAMEATVVSTAMPTVVAELHGLDLYGWVGAIYMLATTVTIPVWGKLADVVGRKPIMLAGIGVFLAGSLGSGLAPSMTALVVMRALQGAGAGALQPVSLTIIGDIFTLAERAKIQGLFGAVWGLSGAVGPLIGGLIVAHASWRWVFFLNLPFGLLSATMLVLFYREQRASARTERRPIDVAGAVVLCCAVVSLLLGAGGRSPRLTLPLSLALVILFVWCERRAEDPLLPLSLLGRRAIAVSSAVSGLMGSVMMGALMYTPLFVQAVLRGTPTEAGTSVAPMLIGWPIASAFSSRLLVTVGYRPMVVGGTFVILTSTAGLYAALSGGPWEIRAASFCLGVGMGLANTALLIAVQESVEHAERGVATASAMFFRTIGGAVTVGFLGAVVAAGLEGKVPAHLLDDLLSREKSAAISPEALAAYEPVLSAALKPAFAITAGLALLTAVGALWFPRRVEREAPAST